MTLRWSRAALLGLVVLATGVIAHTSASGLLPGIGGMAALYAASVVGCAAFLGREASTWRLAGLMVGGQAAVHTFLAATGGHQGQAAADHTHSHGAADQQSVLPWDPRTGMSYDQWQDQQYANAHPPELALPSWLTHAVTDITSNPVMAATHVLAAIAVGAWLTVGERALWAVIKFASNTMPVAARTMRARLSGLTAILLEGIQRLPRPDSFLDPPPQLPVWSRGPVRRGPHMSLLAR